jgi:hypothetical protein
MVQLQVLMGLSSIIGADAVLSVQLYRCSCCIIGAVVVSVQLALAQTRLEEAVLQHPTPLDLLLKRDLDNLSSSSNTSCLV